MHTHRQTHAKAINNQTTKQKQTKKKQKKTNADRQEDRGNAETKKEEISI
jgi:hypothetical protein